MQKHVSVQLSWKCKLATVKSLKVLALRQNDWRNCVLCVGLYAESGATLLVGIWWRVNKNELGVWKALIDSMG